MSMSSYSRDQDYTQTMSGRVIPYRRRESGDTMHTESTLTNGYHPDRTQVPRISKANTRATAALDLGQCRWLHHSLTRRPCITRPSVAGAQRSNSQMTQGSTMIAQKRPSLVTAQCCPMLHKLSANEWLSAKEKRMVWSIRTLSRVMRLWSSSHISSEHRPQFGTSSWQIVGCAKVLPRSGVLPPITRLTKRIYQFKESLTDEPPEVNASSLSSQNATLRLAIVTIYVTLSLAPGGLNNSKD